MSEEMVGKYIHLTWKGYIEGHDNIQNESYKEILNATLYDNYNDDKKAALQLINDRMKRQNKQNSLTNTERKLIENTYSSLMKKGSNKNGDTFKQGDMYNQLIDFFNEKFHKDYIRAFDETGRIYTTKDVSSEEFKSAFKVAAQALKDIKPNKENSIDIFLNKFNQIEKLINSIFLDFGDRANTKKELLNDIATLQKKMVELYTEERKLENGEIIKKYVLEKSKPLNNDMKNFIKDCNNLLSRIRSFYYPAYYEGYLFEYIGQIANLFLNGTYQEITDEEISNAINQLRGQKSEGFEKQTVKIKKIWAPLSISNKQLGTNLKFKESKTQQKIDITITLPKKNFPASLKSYSLQKGKNEVTLVDGTPLLYLMQGLGNDERDTVIKISNHYLNLYSARNKQRQPSKLSLAKKDVLNTMLRVITYQAISGDTYGKINPSQLFILNNKNVNSSSVKVFTIQEVLKEYNSKMNTSSKSRDYLMTILKKPFNTNTYIKAKKKNEKFKAAKNRIEQILFEAHERKITAGIDIWLSSGNKLTIE